jgi:hypothetical protein
MRQCFGVDNSYGSWLGLVSELYEYKTTLMAIFSKTYSEDTLQCPYKDYSSCDRWQANRDLCFVFTFYNDSPTIR